MTIYKVTLSRRTFETAELEIEVPEEHDQAGGEEHAEQLAGDLAEEAVWTLTDREVQVVSSRPL